MDLATLVEDIRTRSEMVTVHREKRMVLVQRCEEFANKLSEKDVTLSQSKLEAVIDLGGILIKIRGAVSEWGEHSHAKYFMQQDRVVGDLSVLNGLLDTHAMHFKTISENELRLQQNRMARARQDDQSELNALVYELVRNTDDLQRLAKEATWDGIRALMQAIQEKLQFIDANSENAQELRRGLGVLYSQVDSEVLPPLTNLNGQVTDRDGNPVIKATAGICDGLWMGTIKVMLRTIPRVEGPEGSSTMTIEREISRWRQLKHNHVLPFYGTCSSGLNTFAVFSWADNGSLAAYIRDHPNCEQMRILAEVSLGLKYLHTFQPVVVHGDLRAANVHISTTGSALISGFGWNNIIADDLSIESTRWMSPELLQADPRTPTPQSDVWSFGMLCLEVLTGRLPFWLKFETDFEVELALMEGTLPERPEPHKSLYRSGLSDEMWSLMNDCWAHQPAARPEMRLLAMKVRKLHLAHSGKYGTGAPNLPTPPGSIRHENHTGGHGRNPPPIATSNAHRPYDTGSRISADGLGSEESGQQSESLNPWPSPEATGFPSSQLPRASDGSAGINVPSQSTPKHRPSSRRSSSIAEYYLDRILSIEFDKFGNVLRGNMEELVSRLLVTTHVPETDSEFCECFLMTYRGFTSTEDLWRMLVCQYHTLTSGQLGDSKKQQHVLMVLSDWLDIQCIQIRDRTFLHEIQNFIRENEWNIGEPETERSKLAIKIEKHLASLNSTPRQHTDRGENQGFNLDTRNLSVASEFAEQLVRIEGGLFQKILASECASWATGISDEELPNLSRFIQNNNRVSDWCLDKILKPDKSVERARVVSFMIQAMNHCLTKNAFSSAQAILSALTHSYVQKLSVTLSHLKSSERENIKQINHTFDVHTQPGEGIGKKRRMSWKPRPTHDTTTCIPPLTKRLQELKQLHKELKDNGGTLVEFQHFTKLWRKSKELVAHKVPQIPVGRESMSTAYRCLEQELRQIEVNADFQAQLDARRKEVVRQEGLEREYRMSGFAAAGFAFK
ncbi:unnamed protein product [Rhizoctonia solani]|uniref:Non-specific serine/threonine protein kinase n=1 Tax=Rhizoctonia solani TaxID=456999 RepID=A0A8H3BNL7_9AGAM|nr:unnamed protein product [Rhizoctonia solani]